MEEKLLEGLKTKYSNLGLSDAVLSGVTATLKDNTTEDNLDATINGAEGLLKTFQSELDKVRSKKAEPKEPKEPKVEVKDEQIELVKGLEEQIKGLSERLEQSEQEKLAEKRFNDVARLASQKGISEDVLRLIDIPKEVEAKEFVEDLAQKLTNAGLMSAPPVDAKRELKSSLEKSIEKAKKEMKL